MTESTLPRWVARLDAKRASGFGDLISVLGHHLKTFEDAERFLGPYNARQRSSSLPYRPPAKEVLSEVVKQGSMNYFSYQAFLNGLIRFCELTKGMKGLPIPHPATIHSIQLPEQAFEIKKCQDGSSQIFISGVEEPIIVTGLRSQEQIKFIIVRPKLSQQGMPSAKNWEVLCFKQAHGYIPDWIDSTVNTRYVGRL